MYLNSYNASAGKSAMEYYTKGLELSVEANNQGQIYYHAINLAFLSVVMDSNESAMNDYAGLAVEKAEAARDSLWKFATLGEAFMYLGDMEKSKEYYSKAADLAEIREKLSMYTNANAGYTALTGISKADDDFLLFLKNKFLT